MMTIVAASHSCQPFPFKIKVGAEFKGDFPFPMRLIYKWRNTIKQGDPKIALTMILIVYNL